MRIFKPILNCFLMAGVLAVAGPVGAETAGQKDGEAHHGQHAIEWPGVYNGFTPCADCSGVKTQLALNPNNTYILMTQFVGKSEREYTEKGKYTWNEASNSVVLTSRDGSSTRQYLVGENMLTQLDGSGRRYTGKDANGWILRRVDMLSSEPKAKHGH